jgi:hypothetical protein
MVTVFKPAVPRNTRKTRHKTEKPDHETHESHEKKSEPRNTRKTRKEIRPPGADQEETIYFLDGVISVTAGGKRQEFLPGMDNRWQSIDSM